MPKVPLERTKELLNKMIELYNQGANKTEIAITLGISTGYVGRLMKSAGYDFKGRTKKSSVETNDTAFASNKLMKNFGTFLVYCRTVVLKMDLNTMAGKLNVTSTKLQQMEKGLINLTLVEWLSYLKALKVNPAEVLVIMRKENLEKHLMTIVGMGE